MSKKPKRLSELDYTFGLGAFRRYKEVTGGDLSHFDEALKPAYALNDEGELDYDVPIRSIDEVEANHRWAVMLKCAHDIYVTVEGGESYPVEFFEVLLDNSPQEDSDKLLEQYLHSNFMGRKLREYYGIPEGKIEEGKKKDPQKGE